MKRKAFFFLQSKEIGFLESFETIGKKTKKKGAIKHFTFTGNIERAFKSKKEAFKLAAKQELCEPQLTFYRKEKEQ